MEEYIVWLAWRKRLNFKPRTPISATGGFEPRGQVAAPQLLMLCYAGYVF